MKKQQRLVLVGICLSIFSLMSSKVGATDRSASVVNGELQWSNGESVHLFGVNYSLPFAFGYRAAKQLGIDHKAAIDMDVDHIARLKLDAYRVHVWDRLISDKQGNIINNEHLALFDYLMMRLAEENITAIITPVAWWGSGYPAPDPLEPGFSADYSKAQMNQEPSAIAATKNYLKQLLTHKNRYTGQQLFNDPNIIAFELFNEPKHTASASESIRYVESLLSTVRSLGGDKPLFYNISEQGNDQEYAKALCKSSVDGIAYQWYPTGLVKNSTLNGNMLPAVSHYTNPFSSITECDNKAKMIYEFDAADITQSVMYPAMARSFREAGFQWATQFAYDPAVIAHTNAEYNTHYLNLLYTPEKAISMLIAGEVFRQLPLNYQSREYPASNVFGDTQLDYQQNASIFNDETQYYYTRTTTIPVKKPTTLEHIAGVGSSSLVSYAGTGAYFLDKIENGIWRLEVYPDVLALSDPHQSSSLRREVARLYVNTHKMSVNVNNLGEQFFVTQVDEMSLGNQKKNRQRASNHTFEVGPGVYLLTKKEEGSVGNVDKRYLLPSIHVRELALVHQPQRQRNVSDKITFEVTLAGNSANDKVSLAIRYQGHRDFTLLPMQKTDSAQHYSVSLPKENSWQQPGVLEYGFVVTQKDQTFTWPGNKKGHPNDWDFVANTYYSTLLTPSGSPINLLNTGEDRQAIFTPKYPKAWPASSAIEDGATITLSYFDEDKSTPGALLRTTLANNNQLKGRDLAGYNGLVIRVRSLSGNDRVKIGLIAQDGLAWGTDFPVKPEWQTLVIPIKQLLPTPVLMANAYPTFMPFTVGPYNMQNDINLNALNGLQLMMGERLSNKATERGIELLDVTLVQL